MKTLFLYILLVILFTIPLTGAGIDIHVPSLPSIINFFNSSALSVKHSVSLYLLGYGIGQLVVGSFSDNFGRQPFLIVGTLLYLLSCIAVNFINSIESFLALRFLQGLLVAGPGIAIKATLSDVFTGKELHKAVALTTISWALGPIIAPAIGGYLQHYFNWHACFNFLAAYTALILILNLALLPETKQASKLDFSTMKDNFFIVTKSLKFYCTAINNGIIYAILSVFNVVGPFIFQESLQLNSIQYGHYALLLGLAWFMGGLLNRFLLHYFKTEKIFTTLLPITFIFIIGIIVINTAVPFNSIITVSEFCFIFFLCGAMGPTTFTLFVSQFPKLGGTVNAVGGLIMMLTGTAATIIAAHLSTSNQIATLIMMLVMIAFTTLLFILYKKLTTTA